MIAVTFALPEESKDFIAKLDASRTVKRGALPVISGELHGKQIVICHTGVGEESCLRQIEPFLRLFAPAVLVTSGFAGGLDPGLSVGDVLIGQNFTHADVAAKINLPHASRGKMTTQARVVESVAEKRALFAETGAAAVDMETAVIFKECQRCNIPTISLRGISDAAGDDLPVPFSIWFDTVKQEPRVGALLRYLATHPAVIPRFTRFVRGISLTRARLTDALAALVARL